MASSDDGLTYRSLVLALRPPFTVMTRRDWDGGQYLPPRGVGCIVAANHLSMVDPLVVAHFLHDHDRPPRFMAKASIFDVPVAGRLLNQVGQIPVHRGSANASLSVQGAVDAVRAGECVVVYPEATLTRDPGLWPMRGKTGVARIALEAGCPVIPVAHWGAQRMLAPYARVPRLVPPPLMTVRAGPPVDLTGLSGPRSARSLRTATERIMTAIVGLLEQIRGETAPTERYDPEKAGTPVTGHPRRQSRT